MKLNECIYAIESTENGKSINKISSELERSWETVDRFLKLYQGSLGISKLTERLESEETDENRLLEEEDPGVDYSRMGCS